MGNCFFTHKWSDLTPNFSFNNSLKRAHFGSVAFSFSGLDFWRFHKFHVNRPRWVLCQILRSIECLVSRSCRPASGLLIAWNKGNHEVLWAFWMGKTRDETRLNYIVCKNIYRGFLKWWYPTTMGFPTKNDHFGVFGGYHYLRKHPYIYIYIYTVTCASLSFGSNGWWLKYG